MPVLPRPMALALVVPMFITPVVPVAVPLSIVIAPELEVAPVALPVPIVKEDEAVEPADWLTVLKVIVPALVPTVPRLMVPLLANMFRVVAPPPKLMVVAVVFSKLEVV